MKSQLAALLARHAARRVYPNMKELAGGEASPREAMGLSSFSADDPVVYFMFHNQDAELRQTEQHMAKMQGEKVDTRKPGPVFSAFAFAVGSRQAFDDLLPAASKAFYKDAKAVGIGDMTLTVHFVPAAAAMHQDYRNNLPHAVVFEPIKEPLQAPVRDTSTDPANLSRITPLRAEDTASITRVALNRVRRLRLGDDV